MCQVKRNWNESYFDRNPFILCFNLLFLSHDKMKYMQIPSTFSVFPVNNKRPLVKWEEYQQRLPNKDEISQWLGKYGNYQKGIVTGKISKILVLDDDGGLDVKKYAVSNTATVKTPRGGTHYYFKWTDELDGKVTTKTEIFPNVDIRGEGGFAVFYGWTKPSYLQTFREPPKWLIDLLPDKQEYRKTDNNIGNSIFQETLNDIHIGNRNDSFTRLAGSLRARGYNSSDMFNLLVPKAREVGFGEQELLTICESVSRYTPNIRIDDSQAQNIDEFLKQQEKVEWIVPNIIAQKSIGFVVGLPETGKTWMMIDLAIKAAQGEKWLGKFETKKVKVLFIDQERFRGETQRRFGTVVAGTNVALTSSNGLWIKSGTTIRLNLQHSFDAFRKELNEIKPDLVIVDSFVSFHTNEENNRKDIQEVLERVKELRNEIGCTFLFIHHENKMAFDKEAGDPSIAQMAGSIAIPAVAEMVLTVRKHDDGSMVYMTKSTLGPTQSPFLVKVVDVDEAKTKIKVEAY